MSTAVPPPVPTISRRRFLAGSALLAASASLVGGAVLRDGPNVLARMAAAGGPRLSMGFVDGASTLAEAAGRTAVPAGSVATGRSDLLGRSVRVRVHGMTPGLGDALPDVRALALDALVPSPLAPTHETLPFYAWSMRRSPNVQASSPVAFSAGVDVAPTLGLRLALTPSGAADASDPVAVFTAGRESGQPKLREGLFLIGVDPATWQQETRVPAADDPAWRGLASIVLSVHATP